MKNTFKLFILLFLVTFFHVANSQPSFRKKRGTRYVSIGGMINAINYVGDLDPGPSFANPAINFTRPDFGVSVTRRIRSRVSYRGSVSWGTLRGDDKVSSVEGDDFFRRMRNLSFRSRVLEVKADVVLDLFENKKEYRYRVDYTPYFFTGLVYFHHNPKAQLGGQWHKLQPMQLEGKKYSLHQVALPIGFGFRYKLSKQLDLAFEMGWRFTLTDYLDDVSSSYVDKDNFSDPVAMQLSDRTAEPFVLNADGSIVSSSDPELFQKMQQIGRNSLMVDDKGRANQPGYGSQGDQRGDVTDKDWYIITGFHLNYILPI